MEELKILEKIYKYYPKNKNFDSEEYQSSDEYLKQQKKRKEALENIEYKHYLEEKLKIIFKNFIVSDWTDLTAYNCYEYRVLLHKNQSILDDDIELMSILKNERLDLFIFVSILEKYYYVQFNKSKYEPESDKWKFEVLKKHHEGSKKELKKLNDFLSSEGYTELKDGIIRKKVKDVGTELKNIGKATIFSCLFTDIIAI